MALITRPRLSNRQFEQKGGDELTLNGINNFLGDLKINGIKIEIDGDLESSDGFVLSYDKTSGKIILKEVEDVSYNGIAERNIGGIKEGDIFTENNMQTMWDSLLMEEKFPTLTAPKINSFTSSQTGFKEIGTTINVTFNCTFNRGSIVIVSQSNPVNLPRSGGVEKFEFYGKNLNEIITTSNLTATTSLNNYSVTIGEHAWYCKVYYLGGVQPKTSYGNNHDYPLQPGSITSSKVSIVGVYPVFATTNNITILTKQTLLAHGGAIIVDLVGESSGYNQTIEVPNVWGKLKTIEQFSDMSNQWELIDKNTFTISAINKNINGSSVSYNQLTHNGSLIGGRKLRLKY